MDLLSRIIKNEGGLVDHPQDPGGITNFGITLPTLTEYFGYKASAEDIKTLTEDEAKLIYEKLYIEKPNFTFITDEALLYLLVDTGVLFGRTTAVRLLQKVVKARVDGILGPRSIEAVQKLDPRSIHQKLLIARLKRIGRLVSSNSLRRTANSDLRDLSVFTEGWINRTLRHIEPLENI